MTDEHENSDSTWSCVVSVAGQEYHVSANPEQQARARLIIKPKPKVTDENRDQVLIDHRDSVRLCGYFITAAISEAIAHHDELKNQQTPEQHHMEKHHWTFNPDAAIRLAIWDLAESIADYIATVYGRAAADRGFDIMSPETRYDSGDVLMYSCLALIEEMGIGTVEPKPEPLPGAQSEGGS